MGSRTQNALLALIFATFYAGIYRLTQSSGLYHSLIDFDPWLFYPPAFIRLAAFLVIGFWSIPALFLAGLCCIDFGLSFRGMGGDLSHKNWAHPVWKISKYLIGAGLFR